MKIIKIFDTIKDGILFILAFLLTPTGSFTALIAIFIVLITIQGFDEMKNMQERSKFSYEVFCVDGNKAYYLHKKYTDYYDFVLTDKPCSKEINKTETEKAKGNDTKMADKIKDDE